MVLNKVLASTNLQTTQLIEVNSKKIWCGEKEPLSLPTVTDFKGSLSEMSEKGKGSISPGNQTSMEFCTLKVSITMIGRRDPGKWSMSMALSKECGRRDATTINLLFDYANNTLFILKHTLSTFPFDDVSLYALAQDKKTIFFCFQCFDNYCPFSLSY